VVVLRIGPDEPTAGWLGVRQSTMTVVASEAARRY
jgi:hypothetical protein